MIVQTDKFPLERRSALLLGEMLLFEMLGRLLHTNPNRPLIEPLITDDLFDSVPFAENQDDTLEGLTLLTRWTAAVGEPIADADLLKLRADFAQLFVSSIPMHVPPWESVYFSENRLTFQTETLDVHGWFERLGFQVHTGSKEPDDHIAFELSFVAHCAELSLRAHENQNDDELSDLFAVQRAFLEKHLLRWGCKWCDLAYANAQTDFYRGLALVVRGGLKELAQVFDLEIPHKIRYPGLNSE